MKREMFIWDANELIPHTNINHHHRPKQKCCNAKTGPAADRLALDTHIVRGTHIGAGIQQQPRAVRVTSVSTGGMHQRRPSALRARACVPTPHAQKQLQCREETQISSEIFSRPPGHETRRIVHGKIFEK